MYHWYFFIQKNGINYHIPPTNHESKLQIKAGYVIALQMPTPLVEVYC